MNEILEKNISIIAKNQTAIYDKGVNDGVLQNIKNSKYIEKTANGSIISLNDVSEVYHKVKVYGDGQEVGVYGKNLFNNDVSLIKEINYIRSSGTYTAYGYEFELPVGTYTISATAKEEGFSDVYLYGYVLDKDNKIIKSDLHAVVNDVCKTTSFTIGENEKYMLIDGQRNGLSHAKQEFAKFDLMLEAGIIATPYEEYKAYQTITATPNGTEVKSMCPNMTFFADGDLDILVEYYSSFGMNEKELAMWNALTNFGKRYSYSRAFAYTDYTGYTIPSGLCRPTQTIGDMFYSYAGTELPKGIDCSGFNITTSTNSYHCISTFAYSYYLKRIYDIGIPACRRYDSFCRACSKLESIEIIRVSEESVFDANSFNGCSSLTHVIFSGVIASDINLQWSPLLDDESAVSLLKCLKENNNYVTTVTLHPDVWARLDAIPAETWGEAGDVRSYIANKGWFFA